MNLSRGDVVVVDYPYSDQTGSKVRPALVVQDDLWNQRLQSTILAVITSSRRRNVGAATQLSVALNDPDSAAAGLRMDSLVQCENLVAFQQQRVRLVIGRFSDRLMQQVNECLKAALGLEGD